MQGFHASSGSLLSHKFIYCEGSSYNPMLAMWWQIYDERDATWYYDMTIIPWRQSSSMNTLLLQIVCCYGVTWSLYPPDVYSFADFPEVVGMGNTRFCSVICAGMQQHQLFCVNLQMVPATWSIFPPCPTPSHVIISCCIPFINKINNRANIF